jgi:hypothetical protein
MKLICPKCAAPLPPTDANLVEGVCFCSRCQEYFKISALIAGEIAARIEKPAYTKLEFVRDADSLDLIVPRGGNRGLGLFLLCFALFWNAITWVGLVASIARGETFVILFLIPFIAIGLGTAAAALYAFCGEFTLAIDRQECCAIWSLFGLHWRKRAPLAEITGVTEGVVYTKNYQPVYGVTINTGSRAIKFGGQLGSDERKWLIGEIAHFVEQTKKRSGR